MEKSIPDVLKDAMDREGVELSPEHPGWIEWRCRGCDKIWYVSADTAYPSGLVCGCGSTSFERV